MNPASKINLLVILIVSGRQSNEVMQSLRREGFYFTVVDSMGGMLNEPTVCLIIGLNSSRMETLTGLVNRCCQPSTEYIPTYLNIQPGNQPLQMIEARVGGALIYAMNVERFEQF